MPPLKINPVGNPFAPKPDQYLPLGQQAADYQDNSLASEYIKATGFEKPDAYKDMGWTQYIANSALAGFNDLMRTNFSFDGYLSPEEAARQENFHMYDQLQRLQSVGRLTGQGNATAALQGGTFPTPNIREIKDSIGGQDMISSQLSKLFQNTAAQSSTGTPVYSMIGDEGMSSLGKMSGTASRTAEEDQLHAMTARDRIMQAFGITPQKNPGLSDHQKLYSQAMKQQISKVSETNAELNRIQGVVNMLQNKGVDWKSIPGLQNDLTRAETNAITSQARVNRIAEIANSQ
jgi:hypothetical protein